MTQYRLSITLLLAAAIYASAQISIQPSAGIENNLPINASHSDSLATDDASINADNFCSPDFDDQFGSANASSSSLKLGLMNSTSGYVLKSLAPRLQPHALHPLLPNF